MEPYIVQITRIETVAFQLDARSRADAESRYLMDGEEVSSDTVSITVDSVDQGTADEILG